MSKEEALIEENKQLRSALVETLESFSSSGTRIYGLRYSLLVKLEKLGLLLTLRDLAHFLDDIRRMNHKYKALNMRLLAILNNDPSIQTIPKLDRPISLVEEEMDDSWSYIPVTIRTATGTLYSDPKGMLGFLYEAGLEARDKGVFEQFFAEEFGKKLSYIADQVAAAYIGQADDQETLSAIEAMYNGVVSEFKLTHGMYPYVTEVVSEQLRRVIGFKVQNMGGGTFNINPIFSDLSGKIRIDESWITQYETGINLR